MPQATEEPRPAESVSYTRLTDADRVTILHLHDEGLTLTAIAQRLDRSVSTIHDVVHTYRSTTDLAKRKLAANAERMADNIIEKGKPRDHIDALYGLKVLEKSEQTHGGLTIVIGGSNHDVKVAVLNALSPQAEHAQSESVQIP